VKTVFVLGELNVDLVASGRDIMPELNREKLLDTFELALGSSSAITACVLSALGLEVHFVSVSGTDEFGRFAVEQLKLHGVNTRHVHMDEQLKTGVTLSLSNKRDRALLTYMGSIPCLAPEHIPLQQIPDGAHVHFGSYYLQDAMRAHWEPLFAGLRQRGITTSFDTGWDPREQWYREQIYGLLRYTDVFLPNEEEAKHIFQVEDVETLAAKLPCERGVVAVKRGSGGSLYVERDGTVHMRRAYRVDPMDPTGAGDSFNAGFICGYLEGMRGKELLAFANACGALATQRIGGAGDIPSREKVREFMESHRYADKSV